MPRGAIAKRSAKPGAPGPPGPSGLGVLAFPDIATMAAFPMAPYVDGVDAHVLTLDDMWSYDPGSTLAPDVTAYAPLGITIVSANGPGNWTRRQETSRRWRDRNAWFVDPVGGDDEDDGLTAGTALGTFAEFMRRVEGNPAGSVAGGGFTVKILSDLSEVVVIDTKHISGTQSLYIFADPILLFAGTISAHVDYDDSIPRVGTITCAGLPVSWTASGLVGKLVRIPSTGVEFWIMQDMGAKVARISPPQAGPFSTAVGAVTNVAFEAYDLVQFGSTVSVISNGGESEQVDFETLELGDVGSHTVEFKLGGSLLESCLLNGVDSYNAAQVTFYNCRYQNDLRADNASRFIVANGYVSGPGGAVARANGRLDFTRVVSYNGWLVQAGGFSACAVADGWAASLGITGVGTAFGVEGNGLLDLERTGPGRLWALDMGAGGVGLSLTAGGLVTYAVSKPFLFTAPTTPVLVGGVAKTIAQLPYENTVDRSAVVIAGTPIDTFDRVAADTTIAVNAYADLLTRVITLSGEKQIDVRVLFAMGFDVASAVSVRILMDGAAQDGASVGTPLGVSVGLSGGVGARITLAAGARTIKVQWKALTGSVFLRPVTLPERESCCMVVREVR